MDLLSKLISSFDAANPNFRPTELYNESWLIKLVLQQASELPTSDYPLGFLDGSNWFSEALLPTAFQARFRSDPLSESRTNADGVVGHFTIGEKAKADLELRGNAAQFTVLEAKVGSPLSAGTSNAKYFDQAARNVACMAEVVGRSQLHASNFERLDFVVLAPRHSIDKGTFEKEMSPGSIRSKVERRVSAYEGQLDQWFEEQFKPLMDRVQLHSVSWEEAIDWVGLERPEYASALSDYYRLCLEFS